MSFFTLMKIWDGTNGPVAVKPASTPAVATDPALVVAVSPNNAIAIAAAQTIAVTNTGTFATQATLAAETTKVIGTVNQGTSPWVVSGTVAFSNTTVAVTNTGTFAVQASIAAAQTLATVTTVGTVTTITNPVLDKPASPTTATWSQAAITFSSSGANIIIAASGSTTIRVMRIFFVNSNTTTATNITIQDTTPTSFSGAFLLQSGGSFSGAPSGEPLWVTASGKGFQLNSSASVQISGVVWYTQS